MPNANDPPLGASAEELAKILNEIEPFGVQFGSGVSVVTLNKNNARWLIRWIQDRKEFYASLRTP